MRLMVARVRAAIVRVETSEGLGTGVIFEADGQNAYLVTNQHVVKDFRSVTVVVNDRDRLNGVVMGSDATRDLAVVKVCCGNFTHLAFGDDDALAAGDTVVLIGYALGLRGAATVTSGIVSAKRYRSDYRSNVIQTDAPMNPGNSGGPMLSMDGKIVGINTYGIEQTQSGRPTEGLGFALSISSALPRIMELRVSAPSPTAVPTPAGPIANFFGPLAGELRHNPDDEQIALSYATVHLGDVDVAAVFHHPYGPETGDWTHGFLLRVQWGYNLRVIVRSGGYWYVDRWTREQEHENLYDGRISGSFDSGAGAQMHLRVVLRGDSIEVFVNYDRVTGEMKLDAVDVREGDIAIGVGLYRGTEVAGAITRYEDFRGRPVR